MRRRLAARPAGAWRRRVSVESALNSPESRTDWAAAWTAGSAARTWISGFASLAEEAASMAKTARRLVATAGRAE